MHRHIDFIRIRTLAHQRTLGRAAALLALVVLLPVLMIAALNNPAAAASPSSELTAAEWAQIQSQIEPRAARAGSQQGMLIADDAASGAQFGYSVAIDGDTAIVGARYMDSDQGAAYVFTRTEEEGWVQEQKLVASDAAEDYYLGASVALEGDTAVVGAYGVASGELEVNRGAVYVFTRNAGVWSQQAKLTASDPVNWDSLGTSVDLSGTTIVAGALGKDLGIGAAYVFTYNGTIWSEQQKLTASDGVRDNYFGTAVAVEGDTVLVGAPGPTNDAPSTDTGAVYVFTRSGTTWTQLQKLSASDPTAKDNFGWSVAISGTTAVAGAPKNLTRKGAAHVFAYNGTSWSHSTKLTASDGEDNALFGWSVDIDGTTIVVGAYGADAAYVFTGSEARSGLTWSEDEKLVAEDDTLAQERFGISVAVDATDEMTVLVGADQANTNKGAAYVFGQSGYEPVPGAFVSATAAGRIGRQLSYGPNDIMRYDGTTWTKWFDAAAAGLTTAIQARFNTNALWIESDDPGTVVMAFTKSGITIPGVEGVVNGTDLVRWDGSAFTLWFSGRAVGLDNLKPESIDGLHVLGGAPEWSEFSGESCEEYLLISTVGMGSVPKPGSAPNDTLSFRGEDVLGFCATALGAEAAGTWEMVLDGSEYKLPGNAITSISLSAEEDVLLLSAKFPYTIGKTTIKPFTVFQFDTTTETFSGPVFRASDVGMNRGARIDGLYLMPFEEVR